MLKSKAKKRKRAAAVAGASPCSAARLTFKTLSRQVAFESDMDGVMVFDPTDRWARMYFLTAVEVRQLIAWLQREAAERPTIKGSVDDFAVGMGDEPTQHRWIECSWRRRKGKLTMVCLCCDGEGDNFETKVQTFEQRFKGETIMVTGETQTCKKCGWFTLTVDQLNTVLQQTKREYAKRQLARLPVDLRRGQKG